MEILTDSRDLSLMGFTEVLGALRQVLWIAGVEGGIHVVAHPCEAALGLLDHLFTVDDKTERLTHAHVVEGLHVDAHGKGIPGARLGLQQRYSRVALDGARL